MNNLLTPHFYDQSGIHSFIRSFIYQLIETKVISLRTNALLKPNAELGILSGDSTQ